MNESFWKKREWTDRILKHPETRAGYRLTSLMLKRERTLKAGVFPMLGMPLAFLVLAILDKRTIDPFSSCVSAGMGDMSVLMFIFTIYVLTMSMLYSPEWEAAWLFRVAPMTSPARLMMGMKMAVLFRLLLPLYLLLGIVYSFLMPVLHAWLYTASLFFLGVLAFGVVSFFIRAYPFSLKRERGDRVRRFGVLIFVLPFFGIMMIFQRFLYKNPMIGIAAHILIVPVYWILESIASRRLNRVLLA